MEETKIAEAVEKSRISKEFATALVKAWGAVEGAAKSNVNPHFKSRYADLGSVMDAVREPFASAGIAVLQFSQPGDAATVESVYVHESGEMLSAGVLSVTPQAAGPQPFGAALSYARRYAMATATGCPQVDDDAESASNHKAPPLPAGIKRADELPPKQQPKAAPQAPAEKYYYCIETVAPESYDVAQKFFDTAEDVTYEKDAQVYVSTRLLASKSAQRCRITEAEYLARKANEPSFSSLKGQADDLPENMGGAGDVLTEEQAEAELLKKKRRTA